MGSATSAAELLLSLINYTRQLLDLTEILLTGTLHQIQLSLSVSCLSAGIFYLIFKVAHCFLSEIAPIHSKADPKIMSLLLFPIGRKFLTQSVHFMLPTNFEDAEGAYWFWPDRPSVCLSVRLYITLHVLRTKTAEALIFHRLEAHEKLEVTYFFLHLQSYARFSKNKMKVCFQNP